MEYLPGGALDGHGGGDLKEQEAAATRDEGHRRRSGLGSGRLDLKP
jgi:hypothetical protein